MRSKPGAFIVVLGSCASSYSIKTPIRSFNEKKPLINVLQPHLRQLLIVKSMYIHSIAAMTAYQILMKLGNKFNILKYLAEYFKKLKV